MVVEILVNNLKIVSNQDVLFVLFIYVTSSFDQLCICLHVVNFYDKFFSSVKNITTETDKIVLKDYYNKYDTLQKLQKNHWAACFSKIVFS